MDVRDQADAAPTRRRPLVSQTAARRLAAETRAEVTPARAVVDLRRDEPLRPAVTEPAVAASPGADAAIIGPAPCPVCGGPGYLDSIDRSRHEQTQRCRPCGRSWTSPLQPIS